MKLVRCLLVLTLPCTAYAGQISMTAAVEQAWNGTPLFHLQLESQKTLFDLSRSDRWKRYVPNEPQMSFASNDNAATHVYSLNETIGFPGKAIAFSRLDRARFAGRKAEYDATRYDIASTIIDAYLNAAVATELVEQQQKSIVDMEELSESLKARYEAGIVTQSDALIADLQLRQQRSDLSLLANNAEAAESLFRRMLGLDHQTTVLTPLPTDLDERLLVEIGSLTSDQLRAEASMQLVEAQRATANWAQFPDFNLGYSKNRYRVPTASPIEDNTTHSYSVGVTLPIFLPINERDEALRQRAQADSDRVAAEMQMINADQERENACREYGRSKTRLAELSEQDIPYAEALIDTTMVSYKSARVGIAEVVLARKTLYDLKTQAVQMQGAVIRSHLKCLGNANG